MERIETRSALPSVPPIERRDEDGDPVALATQAVEELRGAVEQHRTATEERIATELRGVTERLDALEVRSQRPGTGGSGDEPPVERRAFAGFLRRGTEALAPDEVRSLRVSEDTAGGYLAPDEFVAEVIRGIVEFSPVRQAARVGNTASGAVILPKRTGQPTAHWVDETEERQGTEPAYGQLEIPIHEMACYVDVSRRLLEDSAVNVEAEIAFDLAEEFGKLEGGSFVIGNGVKKPLVLPAYYRNRAVWMMNGATLAEVSKLKDGDGRLLWQPSYAEGQPETILGRPVIEAPDMPDIGTAAEPILFGDIASAYRIYDRVSLAIMRDPFTQAKVGQVRFHAYRRVGGGPVLAEALRKLRCATT